MLIRSPHEFELANPEIFSTGFTITNSNIESPNSNGSLALLNNEVHQVNKVNEVLAPELLLNFQSSVASSKGSSNPEDNVLKILELKDSLHSDLIVKLLEGFAQKSPPLPSNQVNIIPETDKALIQSEGNGFTKGTTSIAPVNATVVDVKGIRKDFIKDVSFGENKENVESPAKSIFIRHYF